MKPSLLSQVSLFVLVCLASWTGVAQQSATVPAAATASGAVPRLINYSGVLRDENGKALSGVSGVTFLLYKAEQGGAPVWMETQNITPGRNGQYTVTLGATASEGLPADVFVSGEARWLAVQVAGQAEQPRVLLVAVPYALKAADAETIGGLPPSAFMLATPPNSGALSSPSQTANYFTTLAPSVGGLGTTNFIPIWINSNTLGNSTLYQTGGNVGIGNTTPASKLDVSGGAFIRGTLKLPSTGTATATKGYPSYPTDLQASAFNSSTHMAVNQTFRWQSEPTGNNTSSPSGTLNLLFGSGNTTPTETGLKISKSGIFTFATGQTFPGTGTITGVTAGTALTGGGTSGNVTLNLDTTKVPQLHASNSFTGNVSVSGDVSASTFDGLLITDFAFQNGTNTFVSQQLFKGNVLEMLVGDPGCGSGFAGIGFGGLGGCNNYSLIGDGRSTYLNRPAAGTLHFREGNGEQMTIAAGGHVGIGTTIPTAQLSVLNGTTETNSAPNDGIAGECGTSGCAGVDAIDNSGSGTSVGLSAFSSAGYAGQFAGLVFIGGNLNVTGSITAGAKDFLIDHPLDPANKYLHHASVESSEMKNIYDGTVTTDASGDAVVQLPDWFEAVNTDFRYQLTVIGQFAQAIVAGEITNHQFGIKTDKPNVKVSWQVTGVRQDAFAKAHPLQVEVEKSQRERGYYIHPKLYGAPEEKGLEWAHYPERMKRMKETRAGLKAPTLPQPIKAK